MASKPHPIRFNDWAWSNIEREATRHGISAAEFVRTCAIVGAALSARQAGEIIGFDELLERALNRP